MHFFKNMRQDSILADEVGSVATGKVLTFYSYGSGIVEKWQETSCQDLACKCQ